MNNDPNNMSGNVLGSVDANQGLNNAINGGVNPTPTDNLNTVVTPTPDNQVMLGGNGVVNPTPTPTLNPTPNVEPTPIVNPTPVVSPTEAPQAYTNPQTINNPQSTETNTQTTPNSVPNASDEPTPMPIFESSSQIGTTPPISLEPDKKPKKKTNKLTFILLIVIVLAAIGFGTFYVLKYTNIMNKKPKVIISANPLEFNIGETLPEEIDVYANVTGTALSNCTKDLSKVNTSVAGVYEYTIKCGSSEKTGSITILDNAELVVAVKTVYKVKGETLEAKEFAKEDKTNITYEFVNQTDVDNALKGEAGTYTLKVKATDINNNKSVEVDVKLVVMEYPIKGTLTCTSKSQNIPNLSGEMIVADRFAIVDDTKTNKNNIYGNVASEVYTFVFSDEAEYNTYVSTYNNEGTLIINDITGEVTFDNATKTITITRELDNNALKTEYGEATFENYTSIKAYFEETKGYTCGYERSE